MSLPHRGTTDPRLIQRNVEDIDGRFKTALQLPSCTLASLPSASKHEGCVVFVSDAAAGQKFKGSDGTAWVNLG